MAEMLAGAAIGALWTALLAMIVVDAARDILGSERVKRICVDPDTMLEWTAERMWHATLHVIGNMDQFTKSRSWKALHDG